jgi:hypothetical protein
MSFSIRCSAFFSTQVLKVIFAIATPLALAAPGAHGPDGEHLAGPAASQAQGDRGARIETSSELFELVGQLQGQELSVMIDRYNSNEPVLNAELDVEFGTITAQATFHADQGDYAFDDAALLAALAKPGQHALIFTLSAGDDSDLLEGTLNVAQHDEAHGAHGGHGGHGHFSWGWSVASGLILLAALGLVLRRRHAMRNNSPHRKTS